VNVKEMGVRMQSGYMPAVVGSCQHDNEHLVFIKGISSEFFD
jgi:hypothetical protein